MRNRFSNNAIRESFDTLTTGVCYFAESGILVLCNDTMRRLIYLLTGQRLQIMQDIDSILKIKDVWVLPDSTVWKLSKIKIVSDNKTYFECVAADITELHKRKSELEKSTREHKRLIASMKKTMRNTVEIAKEEEMLALKMRIHGKVGALLQQIRRFHAGNCNDKAKDGIISDLYDVIRMLQGETQSTENDSYTELLDIAKKLGITIDATGQIPKYEKAQNVFFQAIRECITNTVRHAQGTRVNAVVTQEDDGYTFVFTNNGVQPVSQITEGGGLGSLRKIVEAAGGTMTVSVVPEFSLAITIPKESGGKAK